MFSSINNRELATYIWISIFIVLFISISSIRKPLFGVLKFFIGKKISSTIICMLIYTCTIIYLMYEVHFWDRSLLKDSVVWLFGVGLIMLMNSKKALKDDYHFKEILKENLKLTIIVEFIINAYVFNLAIELILLPGVTFLILLQLVSESDKKYIIVTRIINSILSIIGWVVIIHVTYKLNTDFKNFVTLENLRSFLFPVLLTLAYIPFIYGIALFMLYEDFFVRMNMAFRHRKLLGKYAKWQVIKKGGLSLNRARSLAKQLQIFLITTRQELNDAMSKLNI